MNEVEKWYKFLDEHFCQRNENGQRPCNIGSDCFRCLGPEVEQQYKAWLKELDNKLI